MTDTADFRDITPEDVWDDDETVAPEQVTHRLHELRVDLDHLGGGDAPDWDELDDDEQELALAIGEVIVGWIEDRGGDSPVVLAEKIHNVQVYLSRGIVPEWGSLTAYERGIAVQIVRTILEWLAREGPR